MTRVLALSAALTSLALSTGCGFASGALLGAMLDRGAGTEPWMVEPMPTSGMGTSVACLGTDAELSDAELAEGAFEIRGRYLGTVEATALEPGFDDVVPCWSAPSYVLQIEDINGDTWTIGYAWMSLDGWDMTPWPSADEGEQVRALFRADMSEGSEAAGFVLSARGETLYALESGRDGRGLKDGDIAGVSFSSDRVIDTSDSDCGAREALALEFESGTSSLTLYPGEDQGFEVDGDYITTCSIDSWRLEEGAGCDDELRGESSFVMFR